MTKKGGAAPACPAPCNSCPWLTANHGKPHPDGWYTARNRARLWAGLRRGEAMSCHKTDPANPVPEGCTPVPEGTTVHECTGGLILQQREVMKVSAVGGPRPYRKAHKAGLTVPGILRVVERIMFGGVPVIGGLPVTKPDLNAEVSHPPLGDWSAVAEDVRRGAEGAARVRAIKAESAR